MEISNSFALPKQVTIGEDMLLASVKSEDSVKPITKAEEQADEDGIVELENEKSQNDPACAKGLNVGGFFKNLFGKIKKGFNTFKDTLSTALSTAWNWFWTDGSSSKKNNEQYHSI